MGQIVLAASGLGKRYRLGESRAAYGRLSETIWDAVRSPLRRKKGHNSRDLWALKDVDFEISEGEIVGIIGRNGAGKSTLLKILSRITEPTEGTATLTGRVASLLEVGTGFHPELTGRENVFLNGAILGMGRVEIQRKFDDIIEFAGIERFVDTPVKRFSSGMFVRLAFAVAAHLEPDILIIDEVLSVGDAAFQQKSMGKMGEVSKEGRTVLMVSHNMASIRGLCERAFLLEEGRIVKSGTSGDVIAAYLSTERDSNTPEHVWASAPPGLEGVSLKALRLRTDSGQVRSDFGSHEPVIVEAEYSIDRKLPDLEVGFSLHSYDGTYIFFSSDGDDWSEERHPRAPGHYVSRCKIPPNLLNAGSYYVVTSGVIPMVREVLTNLPRLSFTIQATGGPNFRSAERRPGLLSPVLEWEIDKQGE